jgi:hypothetical protein
MIDLCQLEREIGLCAVVKLLNSRTYTAAELADFGLEKGGLCSDYHLFIKPLIGSDGRRLPQAERIYYFEEIENGRGKEYAFWLSR